MLAGKSKGETLIETIVAIFAATISIIFLVSIQGVSYKSRNEIEQVMEGTYRIEALKKLVFCNLSYEEIIENFDDRTKYINGYALESNYMASSDILSIIEESEGSYPTIEISGKEGDGGTMIIDIKYTFENGYSITNIFYRGNYEETEIK